MVRTSFLILLIFFFATTASYAQSVRCQDVYQRDNSQGVRNLWLNFARRARAHSDYKYIADLIMRNLTNLERRSLVYEAKVWATSFSPHRKWVDRALVFPVNLTKKPSGIA